MEHESWCFQGVRQLRCRTAAAEALSVLSGRYFGDQRALKCCGSPPRVCELTCYWQRFTVAQQSYQGFSGYVPGPFKEGFLFEPCEELSETHCPVLFCVPEIAIYTVGDFFDL